MSLSLAGPSSFASASRLEGISPSLGAAASYSVLAGSIVTNTGPTTMPGNLGISPSIGVPPHFTGFPPGIVGPPGVIHDADADAAAAQADATAAFTFLDQGCDTTYAGVQDLTLVSPLGPGTYCADAFILTGNLTLSGSGVWIFKSASTLTTSSNSSVTGGDPCNVWWRLVFVRDYRYRHYIHRKYSRPHRHRPSNRCKPGRSRPGANRSGDAGFQHHHRSNLLHASNRNANLRTTNRDSDTAKRNTDLDQYTVPRLRQPRPEHLQPRLGHLQPQLAAPTATNLPAVTALPGTGGAPIRNDVSPWGLLIAGGFSATGFNLRLSSLP